MKLTNTNRISPIAPRFARTAAALRAATFALLLGAAGPLAAQTASGKFLQTFLLYYGGGPTLVAADAPLLAIVYRSLSDGSRSCQGRRAVV